jgi:TPR repeat protein
MRRTFGRFAKRLGCAALVCSAPGLAQAQTLPTLTGHEPDETICSDMDGFPASAVTDGDLETLWRTEGQTAPCHFVFRFDDPVAVASVTLHNRYGKGAGTPSRRATLWASHQDFGRAYFRIAHEQLNDEGATVFTFDEPVLMRSLKVAVENPERFSGARLTASMAEIEIETVASDTATRWPMPRPQPLANGDPITPQTATRCDDLAANIFNPDSYGYGRTNRDIDVSEALEACLEAVANTPQSARLAYQLARVEALAEDAVQSVARLASPLLADYPPAMLALADAFEDARGVAGNAERASQLRRAAAATGYVPALLAVAHENDDAYRAALLRGEASSDVEGQELDPMLAQLIEVGHVPAYGLYNAYILRSDPSALLGFMPRLEELAEFDLSGALLQHLYNHEHNIPGDRQRSLRWTAERAERFSDPATLGNLSLGRRFVFSDIQGAIPPARRGAYSGDAWPVEQLADRLGGADSARLYRFAFNAALRGAQAGDSDQMYGAATALINGRGVEEDREEGARWMRLAAATGEPRAITYLQNNPWAREP